MRTLRDQLIQRYKYVIQFSTEEIKAIAWAILTHQYLCNGEHLSNTTKRPDEAASPRIIQFVATNEAGGYFTAPYIWVWMMATIEHWQTLIPDWKFDDYDQNLTIADKTQRLAIYTPEEFERFNASFRCMKSKALPENEGTPIKIIHHGAFFNLKNDIRFKNYYLTHEAAAHWTNSPSNAEHEHSIAAQNQVICLLRQSYLQEHRHIQPRVSLLPHNYTSYNTTSLFILELFLALTLTLVFSLSFSLSFSHSCSRSRFLTLTLTLTLVFLLSLSLSWPKKAADITDFFLLITIEEQCNIEISCL